MGNSRWSGVIEVRELLSLRRALRIRAKVFLDADEGRLHAVFGAFESAPSHPGGG